MATRPIPAPETPTMQTARNVCGVVCLLGGVLCLFAYLASMNTSMLCATASQLTWSFMLFSGSPAARLREKMLAERASAPPEKQAEYVEVQPRVPDIAQISFLTGILSFVAVPIVFGPVAVVTGGMAVSQGYRSGLIGMALGLVGVVVWAVVFTMLGPFGQP